MCVYVPICVCVCTNMIIFFPQSCLQTHSIILISLCGEYSRCNILIIWHPIAIVNLLCVKSPEWFHSAGKKIENFFSNWPTSLPFPTIILWKPHTSILEKGSKSRKKSQTHPFSLLCVPQKHQTSSCNVYAETWYQPMQTPCLSFQFLRAPLSWFGGPSSPGWL